MKKYLPHKKFIIIAICILLVAGVFLFTKHRVNKIEVQNSASLTPTQKVAFQDIVNRDTDGDGIADWEEALWGTNTNSVDTDADGISDFDFISSKRAELEKANGGQGENETLNETDLFAQELFATIISLKESGSLTAENLDNISKKLAGSVGEKKELPDIYFIEQLKIKSNPSQKDRLAYNTELQKLINKYADNKLGQELAVFGQVSEDESGKELEPLRQTVKGYLDFSLDFSKVTVPADIAITHLAVINGMQKTGVALSNMLYLYENPLVGLIGVGQYSEYNKRLIQDMEILGSYLKDNDIL